MAAAGQLAPPSKLPRDAQEIVYRPPDSVADPAGRAAEDRIAELEAENRTLRTEATRLRSLLDSAKDHAIITLGPDGRVKDCNEGARAILGYSSAEIIGRSGELLFPAEDRATGVFESEVQRAAQEGCAINERWHLRHDGSRFWASGTMLPLRDDDGRLEGFVNIFRDNTKIRAEEERRALLVAEMGHRIKNLLATVQAVAAQTLRRAGVPETVRKAFNDRLMALARSHDLLTRGGWHGAPLADLVRDAVSPYGGNNLLEVHGPPLRLAPEAVEMLNLALHELSTNAAKHGALSVPEGSVQVCWDLRRTESGTRLVEITWRERGGPPVTQPEHHGFGTRLLEHGLAQKLNGTVKLDFHPEGLECHICLPMMPGSTGSPQERDGRRQIPLPDGPLGECKGPTTSGR